MRRPRNRAVGTLDVNKVMEQFQKAEDSKAHRKGTFEINAPFENALNRILKAKPEAKRKWTAR